MATVIVDGSGLQTDSQPICWLGLRAGGRLALFALFNVHLINWVYCTVPSAVTTEAEASMTIYGQC